MHGVQQWTILVHNHGEAILTSEYLHQPSAFLFYFCMLLGHFNLHTVLWIQIQICRIRMFLDLLDLDPDPLVRGTDPDPSIIKQKQKEELWFLLFWTSLWLFILENFLLASWRPRTKIAGSGAGSIGQRHGSADPSVPKCHRSTSQRAHSYLVGVSIRSIDK